MILGYRVPRFSETSIYPKQTHGSPFFIACSLSKRFKSSIPVGRSRGTLNEGIFQGPQSLEPVDWSLRATRWKTCLKKTAHESNEATCFCKTLKKITLLMMEPKIFVYFFLIIDDFESHMCFCFYLFPLVTVFLVFSGLRLQSSHQQK